MESIFVYLFSIGLLLLFAALLWMLVAAFATHWKWGVGLLVFPPVMFWFLYKHPRQAAKPAALLAVGLMCLSLPAALTRTIAVDMGPYEATVDGELHLTLTDWDRTDYRVLSQKMDVVVLQMANRDVTDETLQLLEGMPQLRELDLANSAITDAGLVSLKQLPLQVLRVTNCNLTNEGFRTHLFEHPTLNSIDVRGTQIGGDVIREWRKVDRSRRAMQGAAIETPSPQSSVVPAIDTPVEAVESPTETTESLPQATPAATTLEVAPAA